MTFRGGFMKADEATLDAVWDAVRVRRAKRRRARRLLGLASMVVALVCVLVVGLRDKPGVWDTAAIALASGAPLPARIQANESEIVTLDDGSRIELAMGSELRRKPNDGAHVDLALIRGRSTFDVVPGGPRAWSVEAGDVVVRVVGTRFSVERTDLEVRVHVERGKVRVEGVRVPGGARTLVAGETVSISIDSRAAELRDPGGDRVGVTSKVRAPPAAPTDDGHDRPSVDAGARRAEPADVQSAPSSRRVAEPAAMAPAVSAAVEPLTPSSSTPRASAGAKQPAADLLALADEARHQGRPRDAALVLERAVTAENEQSSLAAFTLGKVHGDDLADPSTAANWFERAITLGLPSGLDEEAHARAVECFARAGQAEKARGAGARYKAKFPTGRHTERVVRWTASAEH